MLLQGLFQKPKVPAECSVGGDSVNPDQQEPHHTENDDEDDAWSDLESIVISKDMDWLPPRPRLCFCASPSDCCGGKATDDDEFYQKIEDSLVISGSDCT